MSASAGSTECRVAIYARVSTTEQVAGTSLDDQRERCRAFAAARGWTVVTEHVDALSGGTTERPAWRDMLADAEAGLLDAVIVAKLDRFSRSASDAIGQIRRLDALGVAFVSLAESLDLSTPAGRLQLTVLAGVAEFEREIIAERGVSGQRAKARAGRWPGGTAPYGWRLDGKGAEARPTPEDAERVTIRAAYAALVRDGLATGQAAALLNAQGLLTRSGRPWTHQHLRRTLTSPALRGVTWWGQPARRYGGGHSVKLNRNGTPRYGEPIELALPDPPLTPAEWEALQAALARREYGEKAPAKCYPCSGATTACGSRLGGVWRADRDLRQYRCSSSKWTADHTRPRCDCSRIDADWLDERVWGAVVRLLADPNRLLDMARDFLGLRESTAAGADAELAEVTRRIASADRAMVTRTADALRAGVPAGVLAQALAEIESEADALRAHRDRLLAAQADAAADADRASALARLAEHARTRLPHLTLPERAEVLRLLSVRVTLLDPSPRPALRIEGEVPGGGALWFDPGPGPGPSDGDGDPPDAGPRHRGPRRRPVDPVASAAPVARGPAGSPRRHLRRSADGPRGEPRGDGRAATRRSPRRGPVAPVPAPAPAGW
jgi:DNA invertase Pin-like site-specific DNA recombinase